MRILIAGEWCWDFYELSFFNALNNIGHEAHKFSWNNYFRFFPEKNKEPLFISKFHKFQFYFRIGPIVNKINKDFFDYVMSSHLDAILLYNQQFIWAKTIKKIKKIKPKLHITQYCQDNPFSEHEKKHVWRNFKQCIPIVDLNLSVRKCDLFEFKKRKSLKEDVLMQFFDKNLDYEIDRNTVPSKYKCDIVFAGHFENDDRIEYLEAILDRGYDLKLYGGGWNNSRHLLSINSPLHKLYPIYPAIGSEYRQAIAGSKVALCFFSTLNKDGYTTRNFQIPAMKRPLVCQYSEELSKIFRHNEEIIYFNDKNSFFEGLNEILKNDKFRDKIATNSFNLVISNEHDSIGRMKKYINLITNQD